MPRPRGMHKNEKATDFSGSMKRLFRNMKKWRIFLLIALILAATSSILALIAPDKLSDLTDYITAGIRPNTAVLEEMMDKITVTFEDQAKMQEKTKLILASNTVTPEAKDKYLKVLSSLENLSDEEKSKQLLSLDDAVLLFLLDDIEVDTTKITKEEELKMLRLLSTMEGENTTAALGKIEELPVSIYELVKPKIDMEAVKAIAYLLAGIYIISAIFGYLQSFILCTVSNSFAKTLRGRISKKINNLPLKYFDHHEMGDILSRITNDVDSIAQNLNQSLASLVSSLTLFGGSIVMMFYTNWIMAITAILSSFVGFIFMFMILGKSQKYFNQKQEELGSLNAHIEEIYSGHQVVKAYNGEESSLKEFERLNSQLYTSNQRSQFLSGLMPPLMGFIGNFGYVAVCVVGALLTMNGYITFGVIVAFMIYIRLFTNPLSQIAQAMTGLQSTAAASERVFEFLEEEEMSNQEEIKKHLDISKIKGEIEFKNVKFGYDTGKTIIKDFSAKANPGEKIAIVGPTGAGKTTMVNLLMKFYDIEKGDIFIDGVSTKELTRENIHRLFTMVLQDTWLFEGTIRDNIKFNRENITDEEIWEALRVVGVDHFIKTLPGGLDAVIDDGDSISQGQKQLLTIARGMIEDSPFLILDEATSNVDTRTEELVQKAMDKLTEGRTSFIIAHRLSTIKNANLILVMKDGNIVEQGSHDELMKKKGFYAELYNSQFQK